VVSKSKVKLLTVVYAVLCVAFAAVSACACSHHRSAAVEVETSCHGASHEVAERSNKATLNSDSLDTDCGCFASSQVPAIVAKTDDKRSTIEKQIPADLTVSSLGISLAIEPGKPSALSESSHLFYKQELLSSLPSRAPPRL
jgi:hypothetical protein